jgi:hypothetical protein
MVGTSAATTKLSLNQKELEACPCSVTGWRSRERLAAPVAENRDVETFGACSFWRRPDEPLSGDHRRRQLLTPPIQKTPIHPVPPGNVRSIGPRLHQSRNPALLLGARPTPPSLDRCDDFDAIHGTAANTRDRCFGPSGESMAFSAPVTPMERPMHRHLLKKLDVDQDALLKLLHRWRDEAVRAGRRIDVA